MDYKDERRRKVDFGLAQGQRKDRVQAQPELL